MTAETELRLLIRAVNLDAFQAIERTLARLGHDIGSASQRTATSLDPVLRSLTDWARYEEKIAAAQHTRNEAAKKNWKSETDAIQAAINQTQTRIEQEERLFGIQERQARLARDAKTSAMAAVRRDSEMRRLDDQRLADIQNQAHLARRGGPVSQPVFDSVAYAQSQRYQAGLAGISGTDFKGLSSSGIFQAQMNGADSSMVRLGRSSQALQTIAKDATPAIHGIDNLRNSLKGTAAEMERVGHFGKFNLQVLQAFLLYKGFVFLKTQAEEFTRELIETEHQISLVQTQLNGFGKDFRPTVSREVSRIAEETGIAHSTLAAAEYEIVSANIALGDSFRVLELSAKASVSGGLTDAKLAFNAALTQANAFNIAIVNLDKVFDKQFNLVKRGIFTYEQFARVSGEVSIAFAQIDQSVEVANAALATVSQIFTGSQIGEGATGLKNAALALNENADAFERFGLQIHDEAGNFRNFIDIVNELDSALSGMTPKDREAVLLQLFDEKRARRGINVLLTEVDKLNKFYVEQQFALGDLDTAFETMNDDLKTQASIFKNELIPAFEPFVELLRDTLHFTRSISEVVGGPANLAVLAMGVAGGAAAGAANKAALRSGFGGFQPVLQPGGRVVHLPNGGFTLSPGSIQGRMSGIPLPSMGTVGVGALGGALAFHQGQQQGSPGIGGSLATIGGAAAGGAFFGGPVGAATFGGLAAIGLLLGEAMEEEAPEVGKTFAEAFTLALVDESKSVADAFTDALRESAVDQGFSRFFDHDVLYGGTVRQEKELNEFQNLITGLASRLPSNVLVPDSERADLREQDVEFAGLQTLIHDGRLTGIMDMGREAARIAENMSNFSEAPDPREARAAAIQAGITRVIPDRLAPEAAKTASALELLLNTMIDWELTVEQQAKAFEILEGRANTGDPEVDKFLRNQTFLQKLEALAIYGRSVNEQPGKVPEFEKLQASIEGLITGSVDPLVSIFLELGESGKEAAEAWQEVADTLQRFERFQKLMELQFEVSERHVTASIMKRDGTVTPYSDVTTTSTKGVLDILNERFKDAPITDEELARAFYDALREDITGAFMEGFPQMSREDAIKFMVGDLDQTVEQLVVPGMTSLAEAAFAAQDAVEKGLVQSAFYTGEQLGELGTMLQGFNKTIFKVGVVEELQRLAEIAGYGADRFRPAIEQLVRNIHLGGMTFQDVMGDPTKLADLLAELEFGDVQIDQSTNMQVTLRFEGSINTENVVGFAESVMVELNRLAREQSSR